MILKLMSSNRVFNDMMDDNQGKGCRIVSNVAEAHYYLNEQTNEYMLDVTYTIPNRSLSAETFVLQGNAYLMNDDGKTVQSYAYNQ